MKHIKIFLLICLFSTHSYGYFSPITQLPHLEKSTRSAVIYKAMHYITQLFKQFPKTYGSAFTGFTLYALCCTRPLANWCKTYLEKRWDQHLAQLKILLAHRIPAPFPDYCKTVRYTADSTITTTFFRYWGPTYQLTEFRKNIVTNYDKKINKLIQKLSLEDVLIKNTKINWHPWLFSFDTPSTEYSLESIEKVTALATRSEQNSIITSPLFWLISGAIVTGLYIYYFTTPKESEETTLFDTDVTYDTYHIS